MEQHNAMVFDADTVALPDGREETKVCTHYKFSTFVHPSPENTHRSGIFLLLWLDTGTGICHVSHDILQLMSINFDIIMVKS